LLNVSSLLTPETAPTGANVMIVIFVEIWKLFGEIPKRIV
jgi:hypothetical protein